MTIQKFEDIIAWQKAQDLAVEIFADFEATRNFSFRDQICRSVVSISNNIAEGFDRSSDADFCRFLYIALGSASETRSMLYLAGRLNFVNRDRQEQLLSQIDEIGRIIRGLIKSLTIKK
jgi:four helix bundle protein